MESLKGFLKRLDDWLSTAKLASLCLAIGLAGAIEGPVPYPPVLPDWLIKLHREVSPELIGIAIGVLLIDRANEKRAKRSAKQQLKSQLIREMSSKDNGIALRAIEEIRHHRWLYDGSLRNQVFSGANWEGADLAGADFQGSAIIFSNLRGGVDLTAAQLNDTSFDESDLSEVIGLETAYFKKIGMPDGEWYLPGTNLSRFTDPRHTNFWRSNDKNSPAYNVE